MSITVVFDACVLIPYQLSDLLLRLAEAGLYQPVWSDLILDEVERNLPTLGVSEERAARRVTQMRAAFPTATVAGFEALIPVMTNDAKDRHVLAAAVRAGATVIVTANLKDFAGGALDPYGITAVHPDDFLLDQLDLQPMTLLRVINEQRAAYRQPLMSRADFHQTLRATTPKFIDAYETSEQAALDPTLPPPFEASTAEAANAAIYAASGGAADGTTAIGVATIWWLALAHREELRVHLDRLSENPAVWGDYSSVAAEFADLAIAGNVHPAPGDEDICYVKFLPDIDGPVRAFAEAVLPGNVMIMTLVRSPWDGLWRVWGVSWNLFPSPDDIRRPDDADTEASADR